MEQERGQSSLVAQCAEPGDHGLGGAVHEGCRGEGIVGQGVHAVLLRHGAEIPRRRRAQEVAEVMDDARFGVAFGCGIGLRDIDPARHVDVPARRILVQGRAGLLHVRPVEADLPRERLEGLTGG